FAIADNVDARLRLVTHDIGNRGRETFLVGIFVVRLSCLLATKVILQGLRTDQAPDMRRENAIAAAFHGRSMHAGRWERNAWSTYTDEMASGTTPVSAKRPTFNHAFTTPMNCSSFAGSLRNVSLGPS